MAHSVQTQGNWPKYSGTGVSSWAEVEIFLSSTAFRLLLVHTLSPRKWALQVVFLQEKWLMQKADHSPVPGNEIENTCNHTSTSPHVARYFNKFTFSLLIAYNHTKQSYKQISGGITKMGKHQVSNHCNSANSYHGMPVVCHKLLFQGT